MKFEFHNLGPIEHGEVELGKLTVFCGKNNTGKTYVSYMIYGFYYYLKEVVIKSIQECATLYSVCDEYSEINLSVLSENLMAIRDRVEKELLINVPKVFKTDDYMFEECSINIKICNNMQDSLTTINVLKRKMLGVVEEIEEIDVEEKSEELIRIYLRKGYFSLMKEYATVSLIAHITIEHLFDYVVAPVYMLPAERAGLNMFYKELNINRNNVLFEMQSGISEAELSKKISKYPLPISQYINLLNGMDGDGEKSAESECVATLEEKIVRGKFSINNNGTIDFVLNSNKKIDFHLSSSTAKSLFGLDYILKNEIREGCTLIIDEPEQNLHPDNQRFIARLLCKLVNAKVNVIISTHSDYIIKELNNIILLGTRFEGYEKLMQRYGYEERELLKTEDVKGYVFLNNSVREVDIDNEGIKMDIFDEVINGMNEASDDIYYTYCEGKEDGHE